MEKKLAIFLLTAPLLLFHFGNLHAQIGAEAQGGRITQWIAFGLDQEISEHWTSVTDLGYGRHSDPDNYSIVKRAGLNVLTQDFFYKPNEHWGFMFSIGYWRRNFYTDKAPYDARPQPTTFRNEIRPYQKIFYDHKVGSIAVSHVLRTDNRFYYNQYLDGKWPTPFEFRLRFMEIWKFPLSANKKNWIITIDEVLTAIDYYSQDTKALTGKRWSPYQLTENRFSVYYRRSLITQKIDIDLGVMHQYWRDNPGANKFNISYNLMVDIIVYDPFGKSKSKD